MRSKTSFFNPTLFLKNLTRFWPLWGGASAVGALLPLYFLTALIDAGFRSSAGKGLEMTGAYYYAVAYAVPIISLFYAVLCALAVWHYLYNPRSVGLFHSLPITRKGLFVTNFLSGMAMMLIPYAVTGGLVVLITIPAGLFEPVGVLTAVLGVLGHSLFYFSAATFVVFVTGNPFAFAAFYFIFHFLAAGAEWLVSELMTQFYLGVNQAYEGVIEFLSPTIYLVRKVGVLMEYAQTVTPDGWIDYGEVQTVTLVNGWLIAVYAAVGVALLGCAWLLYQRRRSESAGDVVAVGWMKPIFRYGVALCAAATGGTVLYVLFFDFRYNTTARPIPFAVCMAVAGVVGYYIASMLLAKSLKVFRRSGRGVLITAAASAAICFIIASDPFGVEAWVPEAGEVEEIRAYIYSSYGRSVSAGAQDPAVIQKLVGLHQAILAEKDGLRAQWESGDFDNTVHVSLTYWTEKGTVGREYFLFLSDTPTEAVRLAAALVTDPDIQELNIFGDVTPEGDPDITESRLTGGELQLVYDTKTGERSATDLTLEQARELEAAVRRDIQAGNFGKTAFLSDHEEYERSAYCGQFYLNYNLGYRQDQGSKAANIRSRSVSVYLSISTYCEETIQALEDMGFLDASHRLLTHAEFDAMTERDSGEWYYDGPYDYPDGTTVRADGAIVYPDGGVVSTEEIS